MKRPIIKLLTLFVATFAIAAGAIIATPKTASAAIFCYGKAYYKTPDCLIISEICQDTNAQVSFHRITYMCQGAFE